MEVDSNHRFPQAREAFDASAYLRAKREGCSTFAPFYAGAREETRESRGMSDRFLNTGWVLGSKPT
jgi:hypothetical protein